MSVGANAESLLLHGNQMSSILLLQLPKTLQQLCEEMKGLSVSPGFGLQVKNPQQVVCMDNMTYQGLSAQDTV